MFRLHVFEAVPVSVEFLGATMEMREVLCREGRDAKNLLAYQLRDDKPLALGANFESESISQIVLVSFIILNVVSLTHFVH